MALYVNAKSVFAAVSATFVSSAEKPLLRHVRHLRELLDNQVLNTLVWLDTRDMGASGLTKGAVLRTQLHTLMDGHMRIEHSCKSWQSTDSRVVRRSNEITADSHTHDCSAKHSLPFLHTPHTALTPGTLIHSESPIQPLLSSPPTSTTAVVCSTWDSATSQDADNGRISRPFHWLTRDWSTTSPNLTTTGDGRTESHRETRNTWESRQTEPSTGSNNDRLSHSPMPPSSTLGQ